MQRVQKLLSNWGHCSRRDAEKLIEQGRVWVNGKIITIGDQADVKDDIRVDGERVRKPKRMYVKMYKPIGCITAMKDPQKRTVMDIVRLPERVFPVGRLDFNTSGLLLLTNDGDYANRVMHPRHEVKKTYAVKLNKPTTKWMIQELEKGIELRDGKTAPAKVKRVGPTKILITIHEGKNKIVRRMLRKLDYIVVQLERRKIGGLDLKGLKPGEYKIITQKEADKAWG